MDEINLLILQGEWFCHYEQKLMYYFKINATGTYLFRDNLKDLMWSGSINISKTERNTVELILESFGTIELWHISNNEDIDLIINSSKFTFIRI